LSTLTKLFVVLLIICSILLTAATVTFVNRVDDFQKERAGADGKIALLEQERNTAQSEASAARLREQQAQGDFNRARTEIEQQLNEARQQLGQREASINELKTKLAVQDATLTDLASAQKVAQQNVTDLQKRLDQIIAENDKVRLNNAELTGANTDLAKRLDATESERRFLAEQVNQLRSDIAQAHNVLRDRGITLDSMRQRPAAPARLTGVIRDVRRENGISYATISLGSAQGVRKGMQFNIIDQGRSDFLGVITVESVDQNEAFGRLDGPKLAQIRPDHLVLSSLQ
jgi:hypothetical protein